MNGLQAAKACALLGVELAVPMHYGTFPALDATPDAFVEALRRHAPRCRALLPQPGQPLPLPGPRS